MEPRLQADEQGIQERVAQGSNSGFLVRQLHRAFTRVLSDRLVPHDVSPAQWTVLRALWRQDDCSQVDLATAISVEKASLTQVLQAMEHTKLITRERCVEDRRRWLVKLTSRGRKLETQLLPLAVGIEKDALTGFSEEESKEFRRLLVKALRNLQSC